MLLVDSIILSRIGRHARSTAEACPDRPHFVSKVKPSRSTCGAKRLESGNRGCSVAKTHLRRLIAWQPLASHRWHSGPFRGLRLDLEIWSRRCPPRWEALMVFAWGPEWFRSPRPVAALARPSGLRPLDVFPAPAEGGAAGYAVESVNAIRRTGRRGRSQGRALCRDRARVCP